MNNVIHSTDKGINPVANRFKSKMRDKTMKRIFMNLSKSLIVMISFMFLGLHAQYVLAVPGERDWKIEWLDTDLDTGEYTSLVLDSAGAPRIGYDGDHDLWYFKKVGSTWNQEKAGAAQTLHQKHSIALDSQDLPHFGYYGTTFVQGSGVRYINRDEMSWKPWQVVSRGDSVSGNSIALDSNDNPAIAFYRGKSLEYSKLTDRGWVTEVVEDLGLEIFSENVSLIYDNNDNPIICYSDFETGIPGPDAEGPYPLKLKKWDGAVWQTSVVNQGGGWMGGCSMAFDSLGNLKIAYGITTTDITGQHNIKEIRFAQMVNSEWQSEVAADEDVNSEYYLSMDLDSNGNPWIAYSAGGRSNYKLKYVRWDGSKWMNRIIDSEAGYRPSIKIDSNDKVYISYIDNNTGSLSGLKFASSINNLVLNSGFEEGAAHWGFLNGGDTVDTVVFHSGLKSAKINRNLTGSSNYVRSDHVDIIPNAQYTAEVWIKRSDVFTNTGTGGGVARVWWIDVNGGKIKGDIIVSGLIGSSDWQMYSLDLVAPPNAVEAEFEIGLSKGEGTVWFDDTVLFKTNSIPSVNILSPQDGVTVSGLVTISGTAADDMALTSVEVKVDDGVFSPVTGLESWAYELNTMNLINSLHTITVKATDSSGSEVTQTISISVYNSVINNFLLNPGFEEGTAHWGFNNVGDISDTVVFHSGLRSAKIHRNIGGSSNYVRSDHVDIIPNAEYRADVWIKRSEVNGDDSKRGGVSRVWWIDVNGGKIKGDIIVSALTGSSDWQMYSLDLVAPPNAVKAEFEVGISKAKGTVWFDDALFYEIDPGVNGAPAFAPLTQAPVVDTTFGFREAYAFPNPAVNQSDVNYRIKVGLADTVKLRVFNDVGKSIHEAFLGEPGVLNGELVYEYRWNTGSIPSGTYLYLLDATKEGADPIRKKGKFAVIK